MNKQNILNIPELLYRKLQTYQEQSVFPNLDDLAAYILQDFLDKQKSDSEQQEKEANRVIEERLKNLGYM